MVRRKGGWKDEEIFRGMGNGRKGQREVNRREGEDVRRRRGLHCSAIEPRIPVRGHVTSGVLVMCTPPASCHNILLGHHSTVSYTERRILFSDCVHSEL